jgi:hypothetical protein
MLLIVERTCPRPPVQLFQPLSHLNSILFTSIAKFTVWTVDSQEGQQVAFQIHNPPRRIQSIRLKAVLGLKWREPLFKEARHIMPHDKAVDSIKIELNLEAQKSQESQLRGAVFLARDFWMRTTGRPAASSQEAPLALK